MLALVAEARAVGLLRAAVGTPSGRLRAEGSDEELQFEPERDEERQPDRHRRPEPARSEQPREHEGEERESEPRRSEHAPTVAACGSVSARGGTRGRPARRR